MFTSHDGEDYFADSPSIATHDESVIQFQFDWPVALAVVHYESSKKRHDGSVDRRIKARYQRYSEPSRWNTLRALRVL